MKRMIAIAALSGIYSLSQATTLSAASVLASVQHTGAKATIADLGRRDQWQVVTDMIATGDTTWIGLVPKLTPGSDETTVDDLALGLSYALPKNGPAVLAALTAEHVISASRVCSMPFADDIVKDRPAYRRQSLQVLDDVQDPALALSKAACVAILKRAE
jgi:hypothetical protein